MRIKAFGVITAVGALALIAVCTTCHAAPLLPSDLVVVTVGGQASNFPFNETGQLEGSLVTPFMTINNANIGALPLGVDMLEQGGGQFVSDTFLAKQNGANVDLFFQSDIEIQAGRPLFPTVIEDGTLQDITAKLFPNNANPPFQVSVRSDVDTPEPATLLLFGAGALLSLARYKGAKRARLTRAQAECRRRLC